ncbi:hypothetical protein [Nocardioides pacificus]
MDTDSGIEDKARQLLEGRMESVRALTASTANLDQARAAVEAAEKTMADAWTGATKAGWRDSELRQLGFTSPNAKRRGRGTTTPRRRTHPTDGADRDSSG